MAPGLWMLVLSQVTTWIFARSLLTAAVLAFHYGLAGALAYARVRIEDGRCDYNQNRPPSTLGGLTPAEFADQLKRARKVA